MEKITLGDIGMAVAFLVAFISGILYLKKNLKDWVGGAVKADIQALSAKIDVLEKKVEKGDMEACKNFLVSFLATIERGQSIDEIELQRFHEQFDFYTNHDGNSYIKHKVEQLEREQKL
ncbi:MAG: hypothetical protein IKM88_15485 [Lachnospiraceae bacterium]|nr:hypothetical protein [Lachnospiraceae bacterium]